MVRPATKRAASGWRLALLAAASCGLSACESGVAAPTRPSSPDLGPPDVLLDVEPSVLHRDERTSLPTFALLATRAGLVPAGAKAEVVGRAALRSLLAAYHAEDALPTARLGAIHDTGRGPIVVRFDQSVDGLDVFRGGLSIGLDRHLAPLVASGTLYPEVSRRVVAFRASASDAVRVALRAMSGARVRGDELHLAGRESGGYETFTLPALRDEAGRSVVASTPPRAKRVWFPEPEGLRASYYVELDLEVTDPLGASVGAEGPRSFVVAADDETILFENELSAGVAYSYRVWADPGGSFTPWDGPHGTAFTPHPAGAPNGTDPTLVDRVLVTLQNAPFGRNDPWLPPAATELSGNNVWAYADLAAPDGFSAGDLAVAPTAGVFDPAYDPAGGPSDSDDAIRASVTQVFYVTNFLHDLFYGAGWDEASQNPQQDNYGRGGLGTDPIKVEAQDYAGRNNANAFTPADGRSPRIQLYLYDSYAGPRGVTVVSPPSLARTLPVVPSKVGPRSFTVTRRAVLVEDGVDTTSDGCQSPFANASSVAGNVAVLEAGNCGYPTKAYNAQRNGAVGVLVVGTPSTPIPSVLPSSPSAPGTVVIPTQGLAKTSGDELLAALGAQTEVELTMMAAPIDRDGALDTSVSAHEWTHVMTSRLVGNGNGFTENQARGVAEGWSDFVANMVLARAEDAAAPANVGWNGVWPHAGYAVSSPGEDSHYFGNRRYPISADLARNPLTFRHIQTGVALPAVPAPAFGQSGQGNAEVHATGEVWAEMLWECYVSLLRDTGRYTFAQASQRMRDYVVAALKMTPLAPTLIEARDALLVAAYASEPRDHDLFYAAFARRGVGVGARGPSRTSFSNGPVFESFSAGHDLAFASAKLDDSQRPCDADGVLDDSELGVLEVTIRNTGAGTLTGVRVAVSSNLAGLTFPDGPSALFPDIAPYRTGVANLTVSLKGAPSVSDVHFDLTIIDSKLALPRVIDATLDTAVNYDDVPRMASLDTMDAAATVWSVGGSSALSTSQKFQHVFSGTNGSYRLLGNASRSDQYLISPPLALGAKGPFTVTFSHRYKFEQRQGAFRDGGVVELSEDGGATWRDVGEALVSGGYDGVLHASNLVLGGRAAFAGESAAYPATSLGVLALDEALAGKTVLLRFRAATDEGGASGAWDIDDVEVSNLASPPFAARLGHRGLCKNSPPVASAGEGQTVASGALVRLRGSGSDPDGDPLTFVWTQTRGPNVVLSGTGASRALLAPEVTEATVLGFSLVVDDGKVRSASSAVEIAVAPAPQTPSPPTPDAAPPLAPEGCSCRAGGLGLGGVRPASALVALACGVWLVRRRRRSAPARQ